MKTIVLYSCTFRKDLTRTVKLVQSVQKHNKEKIPFYISVPEEDLNLFKEHLKDFEVVLLNEKDILKANPQLDLGKLYQIRGGLRQQVIKSEFWRLRISVNYLVLDSDCIFIRDFYESDFIVKEDVPYSVIHEGRDVLQSTQRFGPYRTRQHFLDDRKPIQAALGREGISYDFGYAPFLWSSKVWGSLEQNYLIPQQKNFLDLIEYCGSEFTWYGESLLKFQAIPIYPREQLFKHYHYEHQLWVDQLLGYKESLLATDYLGVVYQSNWDHGNDYGVSHKKFTSRILRACKRSLKKLRFKISLFYSLIKITRS